MVLPANSTEVTAAAMTVPISTSETAMVPMPERHINWILSQELRPIFTLDDYPVTSDVYPQKFLDYKRELMSSVRDSLLASQEEFAKFQAWVRETYEEEGRVMVPAIDGVQEELSRLSLQEEIHLLFQQGVEEYERDRQAWAVTTDVVGEGKSESEVVESEDGNTVATGADDFEETA